MALKDGIKEEEAGVLAQLAKRRILAKEPVFGQRTVSMRWSNRSLPKTLRFCSIFRPSKPLHHEKNAQSITAAGSRLIDLELRIDLQVVSSVLRRLEVAVPQEVFDAISPS